MLPNASTDNNSNNSRLLSVEVQLSMLGFVSSFYMITYVLQPYLVLL